MKDLLEGAIAKFNEKAASDASLRDELRGVRRTVLLDLRGGVAYHFVLNEGRIDGLVDGTIPNPDITITTDPETLRGLITREMGPFKAYATGKLKFKGSFDDLLRIRKFF